VIALRETPMASPECGPLVSVVIAVYQGAALIRGAVRSALNQTHRNIEVLVVDDGSTDATLEVLATIDDPRVVVLPQANAGTAAARNLALARARGQYIAFLDSDDRWFPGKLAAELHVLEHAPAPVAIAYSSYYAVDDRGRLLNPAPVRVQTGSALDALLDGEDFLMPSVCLFDRTVFDTIGNFNTDRYHEDHEFILRASRRYTVRPTRERLVAYRQSTAGKCRSILADFERARAEELSVVSDFAQTLDDGQRARLRNNALRSLYCRFLMYGFADHATRLQAEVDVAALPTNTKGVLAWLFAKTGINLLTVVRSGVQSYYLLARQRAWRGRLAQSGLELGYD